MKALIYLLFLFVAAPTLFAKTFFAEPFTIWQNGEFLLWTDSENLPLNPAEFCLSLKRANSGIGNPTCRELGEWQRDSISQKYATWLKQNTTNGLTPEHLRARAPAMVSKISSLEDKIVVFMTKKDAKLFVVIFDETASTPKLAGYVPYSDDKILLGDRIAETFFDNHTERRLTAEERRKKASEPDPFFQEVPKAVFWVGASAAYSQAEIPLTPHNWYKNKLNSKVKRYRVTRDSLSLWNFLEDEAAVWSIYGGATWYGIFGGEIFYKYSSHGVKTDPSDTTYNQLSEWRFGMHEIGITLHITHSFHTATWLDIAPFFYFGFQYSFLVEDISLKDDIKKPSAAYESRIQFDDVYKGGVLGIGSRFIVKEKVGLVFRAGVSTRGRSESTTPDPNAVSDPTTIGGITVDGFISAGIEYYWKWK